MKIVPGVHMKEVKSPALETEIREGFAHIEKHFDTIDKSFDRIYASFNNVDKHLDQVNEKIESIHKQSWSQFRWIMGSVLALFATIVSILLKKSLGGV